MNDNNFNVPENENIPEVESIPEVEGAPEAPVAELSFDKDDIEKNKVMAILSYLLFFLPLIACPDSRFARYHANQSLLNVILSVIVSILAAITCGIGAVLAIVPTVFLILGMINANNGEAKPLPLIGKFSIIKVDK